MIVAGTKPLRRLHHEIIDSLPFEVAPMSQAQSRCAGCITPPSVAGVPGGNARRRHKAAAPAASRPPRILLNCQRPVGWCASGVSSLRGRRSVIPWPFTYSSEIGRLVKAPPHGERYRALGHRCPARIVTAAHGPGHQPAKWLQTGCIPWGIETACRVPIFRALWPREPELIR